MKFKSVTYYSYSGKNIDISKLNEIMLLTFLSY